MIGHKPCKKKLRNSKYFGSYCGISYLNLANKSGHLKKKGFGLRKEGIWTHF
jgi:hypothetical protein